MQLKFDSTFPGLVYSLIYQRVILPLLDRAPFFFIFIERNGSKRHQMTMASTRLRHCNHRFSFLFCIVWHGIVFNVFKCSCSVRSLFRVVVSCRRQQSWPHRITIRITRGAIVAVVVIVLSYNRRLLYTVRSFVRSFFLSLSLFHSIWWQCDAMEKHQNRDQMAV